MTLHSLVAALTAGFLLTWMLAGAFRYYALRTGLLDFPNARSSHAVPTPRGGGIAFVATTLASVIVFAWLDSSLREIATALVVGGLLIAVLGYIDDRQHLATRWRLLGHVAAAVWVLGWLGPMPSVPLLGVPVALGWAGIALSLLYMVWMVNLSNFMDGIDGIASVQAITTALGGALLWWLAAPGQGWVVALGLTACVAGFLIWNWPPARIFMGDSGSHFLGFVLGALSLWCAQTAPHLFWAWLVLFGCFMVDATTTLVCRIARGERFDDAHCSHAYQHAARRFGRHLPVTLAVAAINVLWLLPIALGITLQWLDGVAGVVLGYAPLVVLVCRHQAGLQEAPVAHDAWRRTAG
jgi:glycosyltransferase WbpL